MKGIRKRLLALVLTVITVVSLLPPEVVQAVGPIANPTGGGGPGTWQSSGFYVKMDFFKANQYGLQGNKDSYQNIRDNAGNKIMTSYVNFDSLYERAIFERVTTGSAMMTQNYSEGGVDSKEFCQMYSNIDNSFNYSRMRILMDGGKQVISENDNFFNLNAPFILAATSGMYKASDNIFGTNNGIVADMLKETNNCKTWDGAAVAKAINNAFNKYSNPNTASSTSAGLKYRNGIISMFKSQAELTAATAYIRDFFSNTIKTGATICGVKIENPQHAANIAQLYMASFAIIQTNPGAGVYTSLFNNSGGHTFTPWETYKTSKIISNLDSWARSGANSDMNEDGLMFAIRFELYGLDQGSGYTIAARWDVAEHSASTGASLFDLSRPVGIGVYPDTDPGYWSFPVNLTDSNAPAQYQWNIDSYMKYIKAHNGVSLKRLNTWPVEYWAMFQRYYPNTSGGIGGSSTSGWNYRGRITFNLEGFYNNQRTIMAGLTYMGYMGINEGMNTSSEKPNFKMNSYVGQQEYFYPKGEKALAEVYYNNAWGTPSEEWKNTYNLKYTDEEWRVWHGESGILYTIWDRIAQGQVASGTPEQMALHVTVTVTRTLSATKGSTTNDDPIFDTKQLNLVEDCGKHNFRIEEKGNGVAEIHYDIIPSSPCGETHEKTFTSPKLTADGLIGAEAQVTYSSCALSTQFWNNSDYLKNFFYFDEGIGISEEPGAITTVNYDFVSKVEFPSFIANEAAYGDATTDKARNIGSVTATAYNYKPVDGAVYPDSDYKAGRGGYITSDVMRRSVKFETTDDKIILYKSNVHPAYAEIKTNNPSNETFEAMAGTPTTRDLFMGLGADDFRVYMKTTTGATTNPATSRVYSYTITVSQCTGNPTPCPKPCGDPCNPCPGHPTGDGGMSYCSGTVTHTIEHPIDHTFTYTVTIPIDPFTYFDIETTEVWRLSQWGLDGGKEFLTVANPTFDMGTAAWVYNMRNYSSGSGRILFDESMNSNANGDAAPWGDNNRTLPSVSGSAGHKEGVKAAVESVNAAIAAEKAVSGCVFSDYIVLKTSEGYQIPFFHVQEFTNSVAPSSAGEFPDTAEGGALTCPTALTVADDDLDNDDYWWVNGDKLTCASEDNGWHGEAITYAGYNGDYANLSTKYKNDDHKSFLSTKNPLEDALKKENWTLAGYFPNQSRQGSGSTTMGKDYDNKDHIRTAQDVIDTTPNGEYDTGTMWLRYDVVENKFNNGGNNPGYKGVYDNQGGVYREENVPYYEGAPKVNDIVIHDPVSAEYAIVVCNDSEYDLRTNGEMLQGGDPEGALGGVCPDIGCQYSTLTCTRELEQHSASCYQTVESTSVHVGGNNTHVHDEDCYHKHTDACYSATGGAMYWKHDSGCSYANQIHRTYSKNECTTCGHSCGGLYNGEYHDQSSVHHHNSSCYVYDSPWIVPGNKWGNQDKCSYYWPRNCGYLSIQLYFKIDPGDYQVAVMKDAITPVKIVNVTKEQLEQSNTVKFTFDESDYDFSVEDTYFIALKTDFGWECVDEFYQVSVTIYCYEIKDTICGYGEGQHICNGNCSSLELVCDKQENTCTNELNTHVCTPQCQKTYEKVLVCADPHHYEPGEPTDWNSPLYHYPIGDPRCWTRCGDDDRHGTITDVNIPGVGTVSAGGTFINIDREFQIYYPFTGDFAEDPSLKGISETTDTRGYGFVNGMDCREWTDHRWVTFPFNVIDPAGNMRLLGQPIDLNEFSTSETLFTFYCVLGNNEAAQTPVFFTSTAINAPVEDRDAFFNESVGTTNKERVDYKYAARHTAQKVHNIDVVGYIGSLTIHDTGDFRFAELFKAAKGTGDWLIPNLVEEVYLNVPNYVVSDVMDSRHEFITAERDWLDVYSQLYNVYGGKSGGENAAKKPYELPLVPAFNPIPELRNQPMRPGYQLYMDFETVGNYYGENLYCKSGTDEDYIGVEDKSPYYDFADSNLVYKAQIIPKYYSLDLTTGEYTPVDVYYGINNEYVQVNDWDYGYNTTDTSHLQDFYLYLDWLNESERRNYTNAERAATALAVEWSNENRQFSNIKTRTPTSEKDVIGSANVLFLNDINRTFIGSTTTYGQDKNPGSLVDPGWYAAQSQRWHFTLGVPSSAVFVESNLDCTEANIKALQSEDRVIVGTLDITVQGEVWQLKYDGTHLNNDGYTIFEDDPEPYDPPSFDKDGDPVDPDSPENVTGDDPIYVIYPPDKTSKDDVIVQGTH